MIVSMLTRQSKFYTHFMHSIFKLRRGKSKGRRERFIRIKGLSGLDKITQHTVKI